MDSQITKIDLFYLEDIELARQLVELGYRCVGAALGALGDDAALSSHRYAHIHPLRSHHKPANGWSEALTACALVVHSAGGAGRS